MILKSLVLVLCVLCIIIVFLCFNFVCFTTIRLHSEFYCYFVKIIRSLVTFFHSLNHALPKIGLERDEPKILVPDFNQVSFSLLFQEEETLTDRLVLLLRCCCCYLTNSSIKSEITPVFQWKTKPSIASMHCD